MNNPIYIDSSTARENFSSILNSVFNGKKTYVVKKSGIPIAQIAYFDKENTKKDKFMDFAGILSEKEGDKILKLIKTGRNDKSKLKKKLVN